ncbi:Chaperone DnaJ [Gossypium australe]|uniref:Chaperone DnaJ n=1 Tax=Gossypium australe TaxID=47621 RepID=A0A5B6V838_9ROSI|nr:Chaperone DnaJ [Gossypium australe]
MGKRKNSGVSRDEEEEVEVENHSSSNEKSLYEVLNVAKTASQQEIKKAYYKLALRLHPDKNPGDEDAKEKFQQLQKVISILGDEEKRAVYDQTGCVDDAVNPKLDSHRFKDLLDEAIAAGELKETRAYRKWANKVSEMKPPTSPLRRKEK